MRSMRKIFLTLIICLGLGVGLERLYYRQNGGFSLSKVLSSSPAASLSELPVWIDPLLDQPFHLIGSGGTSFVFLGADEQTILKLFKHQHLVPNSFLFHFSFPGVTDRFRIEAILKREKMQSHKRKPFFFTSCTLAYEQLKEETGLLYLSLAPDPRLSREVELIDAWGISHMLLLSRTEFALQQKADLLFPYLEKQLVLGEEQAKKAIDALFHLIQKRCAQEIGDRDPNLLINFGFVNGKAVEFDLGSYYVDPSLHSLSAIRQELFFSTFALQKWLEKRSLSLLSYLLDKIKNSLKQEITQSSPLQESLPQSPLK